MPTLRSITTRPGLLFVVGLLFLGLAGAGLALVLMRTASATQKATQQVEPLPIVEVLGIVATPETPVPLPHTGPQSPTVPPRPTSPSPTLAPVSTEAPSTFLASVEWPGRIEAGDSRTVIVRLVRTGNEATTPTALTPENSLQSGTLNIDAPDILPDQPSIERLVPRVNATLDSTAFKISPLEQKYQSVGDKDLLWIWSISSDAKGPQELTVVLTIQWTDGIVGGFQLDEESLWAITIETEVKKPLIPLEDLKLGSLLSSFIGSGLSVPFLYGIVKTSRENRKLRRESTDRQQQEDSP